MSLRYNLEEMICIYDTILKNFEIYENMGDVVSKEKTDTCLILNKVVEELDKAGYIRTLGAIRDKLTISKKNKAIVPLFKESKEKIIKNKNYNNQNFLNFIDCENLNIEIEKHIEKNKNKIEEVIKTILNYSTDIKNVIYNKFENNVDYYSCIYFILKNKLATYYNNSLLINKIEKELKLDNKNNLPNNILNNLRTQNGKFYGFDDKKENATIKFSNDGTGLGKSYSVISEFIHNSYDKNKSLIFTTPMKNQLVLNEKLVIKANDKNIRILQALSIDDLLDPNSINMASKAKKAYDESIEEIQSKYLSSCLTDKDVKFISIVKNLFHDLNIKDNPIIYENIKRSFSCLNELRYNQEYLKQSEEERKNILSTKEDNSPDYDLSNIDNNIKKYKENISNYKKEFINKIQNVILLILNELTKHKLNESVLYDTCYFEDKIKFKYEKILNLYEMLFPFNVAKHHKTIILMTSDKFKTFVNIIDLSKDKTKLVNRSFKIDNLIGYKKNTEIDVNFFDDKEQENYNYENNIGLQEGLSRNHESKNSLIKSYFLDIDESNLFFKNNISFNIIIDEEHSAYNKFNSECFNELLNKKENIEHIIASAKRVSISSDKNSVNESFKNNIIKGILMQYDKIYGENYKTREEIEILSDKIFDLFLFNNSGMNLKKNDESTILNITKNNFIFSTSNSFEQTYLKHVKFKNDSKGKIIVYYDHQDEQEISLFEISFVIIGIFFAISKIKNTSEDQNFIASIENDGGQNQNESLLNIIKKRNLLSKGFIADTLFSNRPLKDFEIDYFYVYFIPKLFLNLTPIDDIGKRFILTDKFNNNEIKVRLTINTITYPPEVSFLRILYGTKNNIITLSATAGMLNYKNGNYDRDFFEFYKKEFNFNVENKSKDNTKTEDNLYIPEQIRKERGNIRKDINVCFFNKFDTYESQKIKKQHTSDFDMYFNLNNEHIIFFNEYKKQEHISSYNSNLYENESKNNLLYFLQKELNKNENSLILTLRKSHITWGIKAILKLEQKKSKKISFTKNSISFSYDENINNIKKKTIIFYDNDTMKNNPDWEQDLNINKENGETIIFVSYLQVAGTGINLILNNNGIIQDFDSLYLIDNPFYSSIIDKDRSFNTTENNFLLLRHIADENNNNLFGEKIKMSIFKEPLYLNDKYKNYLEKEHKLSLVKEVMQAVGRIERTDVNTYTNLYLNDSLNSSVYSILKEIKNDTGFFTGVSLLNYHYINKAIEKVESKKLINNQIKDINNKYIIAYDFFNNYNNPKNFRNTVLNDLKQGNKEAIQFNSLLRSKISYGNPQEYINQLKNSDYVLNSRYKNYLIEVIDSLFFFDINSDLPLYHNTYLLFEESSEIIDYIENKNSNYDNKYYLITDAINLNNVYNLGDYKDVYKLSNWFSLENKEHIEYILKENPINIKCHINPIFYSILKGNYAENIFLTYLNKNLNNNNKLITNEELLTIDSQLIEKYDFYIKKDYNIIAIDTKSYSDMTINSKYKEFQKKQAEKYKSLCNILNEKNEYKDYNITVIYLNVIGTVKDSVETLDNMVNKNIYNILFFQVKKSYHEKYFNDKEDNKKMKRQGTKLKENIIVSEKLNTLLGD